MDDDTLADAISRLYPGLSKEDATAIANRAARAAEKLLNDPPVIAATLKKGRESRRLTIAQASREFGWSPSKTARFEVGTTLPSTVELEAMLTYYDIVDPEEVEALIIETRRLRTERNRRSHP